MSNGFFIALEGGDGAGKTTQAPLLAERLRADYPGLDVLSVRQPGGTILGESIRDLVLHGDEMCPQAEALLYAADRAQHVAEVIAPALARDAVVITDRFIDSSIAYQAFGRGLDPDDVRRLSLFATAGLLPNLVIVLDLDEAQGVGRLPDAPDRLERAGADFHARVRDYYRTVAIADPAHYALVDATGAVGEVAARVGDAVGPAVGRWRAGVTAPR